MECEKKKRGRPRKVVSVVQNDIIIVDDPLPVPASTTEPIPDISTEIIIETKKEHPVQSTDLEKIIIRTQHVEITGNRFILFTNGKKVGEFSSSHFGKETNNSEK